MMNFSSILKWLHIHYKKGSLLFLLLLLFVLTVMYFCEIEAVWTIATFITMSINILVYRTKRIPGLVVSLCYSVLLALGIAFSVVAAFMIPLPDSLDPNIFSYIPISLITWSIIVFDIPGRIKQKASKIVSDETQDVPVPNVLESYTPVEEDLYDESDFDTPEYYTNPLIESQSDTALIHISKTKQRLRLWSGGILIVLSLISTIVSAYADDGILNIWQSWVFWCLIGGFSGIATGFSIIWGGFVKGLFTVLICFCLLCLGTGIFYFYRYLYEINIFLFTGAIIPGIVLLIVAIRQIIKQAIIKQQFLSLRHYQNVYYEIVYDVSLVDNMPLSECQSILCVSVTEITNHKTGFLKSLVARALWLTHKNQLFFAGARRRKSDVMTELFFITECDETALTLLEHQLKNTKTYTVAISKTPPEQLYKNLLCSPK